MLPKFIFKLVSLKTNKKNIFLKLIAAVSHKASTIAIGSIASKRI